MPNQTPGKNGLRRWVRSQNFERLAVKSGVGQRLRISKGGDIVVRVEADGLAQRLDAGFVLPRPRQDDA